MAKVLKQVWVLNKTCENIGGVEFKTSRVYDKLYDALTAIGIWSNMKAKENYEVSIVPTDESNSFEVIFRATRFTDHTELETMELVKTDFVGSEKNKDEA